MVSPQLMVPPATVSQRSYFAGWTRLQSHTFKPLFIGAFCAADDRFGKRVGTHSAGQIGWPVHALGPDLHHYARAFILSFVACAIGLGRMGRCNTAILASPGSRYLTTSFQLLLSPAAQHRFPVRASRFIQTW